MAEHNRLAAYASSFSGIIALDEPEEEELGRLALARFTAGLNGPDAEVAEETVRVTAARLSAAELAGEATLSANLPRLARELEIEFLKLPRLK